MSYAGLIKRLFERTGMTVRAYADAINITEAHLSNILGGKQRGSHKILESCLAYADLTTDDLRLPDANAADEQKLELWRLFEPLNEKNRALVMGLVQQFHDGQVALAKGRSKRK